MRRAALLGLVGWARIAAADPPAPPTFAIDVRSNDVVADKMGLALEDGLRAAGAAPRAKYRAKGTRKDRIAASTDACPSAKTTECAAVIGAKLAVDYMIYGEVETHGAHFVLTMSVVNVDTKRRVRSLREQVLKTASGATWAKQIFERVVDNATGTLSISSNVSRATVVVDGQPAIELYQRRGLVGGLSLGRHAIEVRAPGYKPYTDEVVIDGDATLNVLLDQQ